MLDKIIFTKEYINNKRLEFKCDPIILEKTIYAFGLLEALVKSEMNFIFKGGSSLLLLLENPLRLSTDIDIIVEPGTNLLQYIFKISKTYPFIRYEEVVRKDSNNIFKNHFKFFYKSLINNNKEASILLDVLFEKNHYSKILEKEIKNSFIKTYGKPIFVKTPNHESLLGDKLTAFAPKTIGIKPIVEKDNGKFVDKRIETIKQFFDIASLFDVITNFEDVKDSYIRTAKLELKYRGLNISINECLFDSFDAAVSIMCKGKIDSESYRDYLCGIKGLSNFLIGTKFNAEIAYKFAAKVMYLIACILKNESSKNKIKEQELLQGKYSKLNYLKKLDKHFYDMAAWSVRIKEQFKEN